MTDGHDVVPSGGTRVPYDALPAPVRAWVDAELGSPVVTSVTQPGGFSPGVAARLSCADGTRAFVKAVSSEVNADSARLHRREASVLALLPRGLPVPRLLATYDATPWVALLVDDVDGRHPVLPWDGHELVLLLAGLREVAAVTVPALSALGAHVDEWRGWRTLAAGPVPDGLDPWAVRHLDRLTALESDVADALPPVCLQHSDARVDNTLLARGRAWLVDWPWAGLAPAWFDVVGLAPSVRMQGGPEPERLLDTSGLVGPDDRDAVTVFVAALAGYFVQHSRLPAPPGIPAVREFQAAQGRVTLGWLRQRTGW